MPYKPAHQSPRSATRRRGVVTLLSVAAALALPASMAHAQLKSGDNPEASEIWQKVRANLFQNRTLQPATDEQLLLEAPSRAADAAVVPIAIRTRLPQTPTQYVDKVYLLIDNNPSPIAAIFQFTPSSGRADIETRVRIDEYSFVRVVAEMNDGRLFVTQRFVKASGGCSAPPGKDNAAAMVNLGKMRFQVVGTMDIGRPVLAQLMISHPNDSGMAMDQLTRQYTPAHYVRRVDVTYGGKPVMSADIDFSISENPNLRFYFVPTGDGELKAEVVDSKDLRFSGSLPVRAPS